ncbi:MAG TPA: GGDEF domain-containing protein [Thermoanaerobaculia bacterium]|jgi:diguanylate cyclase (GGDEF)-like protein|nr:GGDEF domain-containing protein [Thermoanaerobaculia bacterium]
MQFSVLGLFVQTAGVGMLAAIFLYISRENRDRVLQAMGYAWLFLFVALASLTTFLEIDIPFGNFPYQYLKLLYFVTLVVAADRMSHDSPLGRPLGLAGLIAAAVSFAIVFFAHAGSLSYAIHMLIGAVAWLLVTVLVLRSRLPGLGRPLCALLSFLTALLHIAYVILYGVSAAHHDRTVPFLAYTSFYDLFLEMLFGIGLIIWAMEETERKLAGVHARALDDTHRSRKRAQIDPLTEAYNRLFLDENRPALSRDPAGGSIVLIDMDGLKAINDREGHEEGDRAIWTVAAAIKKLIRGDDYVIRWGGDEFLVVLPGMDEEVARRRFYMLPAKLEEVRKSPRNDARSYKKFLSASVGVTPYSTKVPFDTAVEIADKVMYEKKKARKTVRASGLERLAQPRTSQAPYDKPN